ncbi:MAG: TonB-dependent receptor [Pseudomonadota bacterium]
MQNVKATLLSSVAASILAHPALAQQTDQDAVAVDEVIEVQGKFQNSLVNRLPIELEKVPYSIDVIDREFIDERGFIRPLEALQTLPNVFLFGDEFSSGAPFFLIRGFAASILVNNRPESNSRGIGRRDNAFVERYEVLKGPASISFGQVLPGGIINTVTKLPTADSGLDFEVRGGSFGTFRTELDANTGELLDGKLTARITAAYENNEFANGLENRQVTAIRPIVAYEFTPATRARLSVAYRDLDTRPGLKFGVFRDGTVPEAFNNETFFGPPAESKTEGSDLFIDSEVSHEFLDDLKLTVRGSYQETSFDYQNTQGFYNYQFDQDSTGGFGFGISDLNPILYSYDSIGEFDEQVVYLDAQLAWTNVGGSWVDVVVGGTYQDTESEEPFLVATPGIFPGNGFASRQLNVINPDFSQLNVPITPTGFVAGENVQNNRMTDNDLLSVYAELSLQPLDWLNILAGVRYDNLTTDFFQDFRDTGGTSITDTSNEVDDVSFRIGATAEVIEDVNVYISYAESFIPQEGVEEDGSPIGPETAYSYELGVKASLLENRLTVRAALFNTVRNNLAATPPGLPPGTDFQIRVNEQRHRGFELFAAGNITDAIDFTLSYGFLDADFTEDVAGSFDELVPTIAPDHTLSAFGSYTVQEGPLANLKLGGGIRYISNRKSPTISDIEQPGYTLVDGFVSYVIDDNYKVQINANNLLNNEYLEEVGNSGRTSGGFDFGEPRVILATINASF